jgi:outer membrane protein assembly factor BamB
VTQDVLDERTGGWADGSWSARPWAGGSIVDGVWVGGLSEVDNTGHALIDLGELAVAPDGGGDADAGTGQGRAAPRIGQVRARFTRARIAGAIGVACLYVLSAATVPGPPRGALLWTVALNDSGQLYVSGDTVYLAPEGSAPAVRAVDARTGRTLWRVDVPWTPQRFLQMGGGLDAVVVQTSTVDPSDPAQGAETVFVRRTTGKVVTEANGEPVAAVGAAMLQIGSVRRCGPQATMQCATAELVDPTTGASSWQRTFSSDTRVLARGQGPGTFVTATGDGSLTLYSAATGQVLARQKGTLTGGGGIRLSAYVAGVLIVGVAGTEQSSITGYRAADLRRLWTVELARDTGGRQDDTSLVDLTRCGGAACVIDGGGTAVLDPATGVLRFRTDQHVIGEIGDGVFLAVPYLGHLDQTGRYVSDIFALDPATGAVRATIGNAAPVGDPSAGLISRAGADGTIFAAVRPDGRSEALLTAAGHDLVCVADPPALTCLDDSGNLRAWGIGVS